MLASVYFIYVYIRGLQLGIYLVQMSRTYYLISCCENGCPMLLWILAIKTAAFRLMWNTVNRNTLSLAVETLPNVPRKATGKDCTCLHDARYDNRCILKHNNWTFVSMCTGGCWKQTVALFWKKKLKKSYGLIHNRRSRNSRLINNDMDCWAKTNLSRLKISSHPPFPCLLYQSFWQEMQKIRGYVERTPSYQASIHLFT